MALIFQLCTENLKKNIHTTIKIKPILVQILAILQDRNDRYDNDKNRKVNSTPSISNKNCLKPKTTSKATPLVPKNKPMRYILPTLQPKPAPTPAKERTPGPGVTIIKKLIIM